MLRMCRIDWDGEEMIEPCLSGRVRLQEIGDQNEVDRSEMSDYSNPDDDFGPTQEERRLSAVIDTLRAEIERLTADKAAISQTASDYLHEIGRLRAALRAIGDQTFCDGVWSRNLARYALGAQSGRTDAMNDAQSTINGLKAQDCPGGGWNGMPADLERATVADCLAHNACGCIYGDAVQHLKRLRATLTEIAENHPMSHSGEIARKALEEK